MPYVCPTAESVTRRQPADKRVVAVQVVITTPRNVDYAGTDANVQFAVGGTIVPFDKPDYDDFERGDTDTYDFRLTPMTLGELRGSQIRLFHDNAGDDAGWYVSRVTMQIRFENSSLFHVYKTWGTVGWLATDEPPYYTTEVILQDGTPV